MNTPRTIWRAAAWMILPIAAMAQSASRTASPLDPTAAHSPVSPLHYESALSGYRPTEDEVAPAKEWRALNDTVGRTGSMSGEMKGMDHSAMESMDHGATDKKASAKSDTAVPSTSDSPPRNDSMPEMDMSSGDPSKHH